MTPSWPDLVVGGIAAYFAWKGYRHGFVAELAGPVAVIVAAFAAFRYTGVFDAEVATYTHLGPGSAHAVGTIVFAVLVYAIVALTAALLDRIASLPVIAWVNAIAGAFVGSLKALFGAWVILYVALFFPLTHDLRADLHRSELVQLITAPNAGVDRDARVFLPWFARPLLEPFFDRHHI